MFGNPEEQLGEILVIHFFLRSLSASIWHSTGEVARHRSELIG
jgi:hypothetical protein